MATSGWEEDAEAPFPRGGGSALTPLEYRQVTAQARRDAAADAAGGASAKRQKRSPSSGRAPPPAAGKAVATLSRNDLKVGVRVLAAVADVSSSRLLLQLPGGLSGVVAAREISDELAAALDAECDQPARVAHPQA